MELRQLERLMRAMEETGTSEVSIKKEDYEVSLRRGTTVVREEGVVLPQVAKPKASPLGKSSPELGRSAEPAAEAPAEDTKNATFVTSPMVGTFYCAPAPDEPNFVKVGDRVNADTVVCIVEAMKVMNEVKAGVTGTIKEVLVENGHPVEFGSKMFRVASAE